MFYLLVFFLLLFLAFGKSQKGFIYYISIFIATVVAVFLLAILAVFLFQK